MITSTEQLDNHSSKVNPHHSDAINLFNNMQWQHETTMGNYLLKTEQSIMALRHYKEALQLSKSLFVKYKSKITSPDSLVPIVVISYLNLADYWEHQGKLTNQKNCLVHAFDYLIDAFDNPESSSSLRDYICQGLNKIYPELIICLQECGDFQTLEIKKNTLLSL